MIVRVIGAIKMGESHPLFGPSVRARLKHANEYMMSRALMGSSANHENLALLDFGSGAGRRKTATAAWCQFLFDTSGLTTILQAIHMTRKNHCQVTAPAISLPVSRAKTECATSLDSQADDIIQTTSDAKQSQCLLLLFGVWESQDG